MNPNTQKITDLYRAVIADGGTSKVLREDAIHAVTTQIQPLIDAGEIVPDVYSWVRSMIVAADKRDGAAVDRVLAAIGRGEDDLGLGAEPYLDYVAVLGRGGRKIYRFLSAPDLDEMDELRHRNVRSANRSYQRDWKPGYDAWREVLRRNPTIGDAVVSGDLPHAEGLFDTA